MTPKFDASIRACRAVLQGRRIPSVQGQAGKARQDRISAVVYPKADMVHEFTSAVASCSIAAHPAHQKR